VSRLLGKVRTARRIGPRGVVRVLGDRSRVWRERLVVERLHPVWPSTGAVRKALRSSDDLELLTAGEVGQVRFFVAGDGLPALAVAADEAVRSALVARADLFCDHVFDFLGSGPTSLGPEIDWSCDFKSGYRWDERYMADLCLVDLSDDADVKVPWELARHQHFVTLGQAYLLTGDEKYAREFVAQLNAWMDKNPPLLGVAWACAMDVALRTISWTWAWHLFSRSPSFGAAARRRFLAGILAHGRFISGHLEWDDVRGNHYLSDGAGLAVIGLAFPEFRESAAWCDKGFEIVWGELPLQVLPDGVDFEMSTSYQRLVVELFATPTLLARLNEVAVPETVWARIEAALEFVMAATRPDGEIALFGDADDGRVQILSEATRTRINDHRYLLAVGAALFGRGDMKAASGGWHPELDWLLTSEDRARFDSIAEVSDHDPKAFAHGGFYLMRGGGLWLLADCGPVGLAGLGGHGHNDALSFELCVGEVPVIVDPGTYVYTSDIAARTELRGTRAHNVLVLDGGEMAELGPGPWRMQDQARAEVTCWDPDGRTQVLEGVHHGYERLAEAVLVRRRFELDTSLGVLRIEDSLEGEGIHDAEVAFHTALSVRLEGEAADLMDGDLVVARATFQGPPAEGFVDEAWLSPSYGVRYRGRRFGWRANRLEPPAVLVTCFAREGTA